MREDSLATIPATAPPAAPMATLAAWATFKYWPALPGWLQCTVVFAFFGAFLGMCAGLDDSPKAADREENRP